MKKDRALSHARFAASLIFDQVQNSSRASSSVRARRTGFSGNLFERVSKDVKEILVSGETADPNVVNVSSPTLIMLDSGIYSENHIPRQQRGGQDRWGSINSSVRLRDFLETSLQCDISMLPEDTKERISEPLTFYVLPLSLMEDGPLASRLSARFYDVRFFHKIFRRILRFDVSSKDFVSTSVEDIEKRHQMSRVWLRSSPKIQNGSRV